MPTDTAYDRLVAALDAAGCGPRGNGNKSARCPAHADRNPSLSVSPGAKGGVVIKCQAGCTTESVVEALGLTLSDLFDEPGRTAADRPRIVDRYAYTDEGGELLFEAVRYAPKQFRQRRPDPDRPGAWLWNLDGTRRVLFRLSKVREAARVGGEVFVVEGEKDVAALERAGHVATCNPMGAGKWEDHYASYLKGARVYVIADKDQAGRAHANHVAASLTNAGVQVVGLFEAATGKDAADHLGAGRTVDEFQPIGLVADDDPETPDVLGAETWRERDLAPILAGIEAGTLTRPTPTVAGRTDGACLFYAGRVNGIMGESGDGKTWVALHACHQEIAADRHAIYLDFEDNEEAIVGRLLDLGAQPDAILAHYHYLRPDEPYGADAADRLCELVRRVAPSLVVIDSTGESMAIDNANPNDDKDVTRWARRLPASIAKLGPGVLTLDHVTKDRTTRGLWATGSQRKRAIITGAAYLVDVIHEFGPGRRGAAKLTVAKDRCGTYVRGSKAADFTLDATGDGLAAELTCPEPSPTQGDFRPTHLMEAVSRWLEINPGATKNEIEKSVRGRAEYKRSALAILITEQRIEATKDGQAIRHRAVQPYREADEATTPEKEEEPW